MTRTLRIAPEALAEADETANWYESKRPGLGAMLRRRADAAFAHIGQYPESYESIDDELRRCFVRQFPLVVIYRVTTTIVEILAVLPTQSDPTALEIIARSRHT